MAHSTNGLYRFLESPRIYDFWQSLVSRVNARRIVVDQYIKPQAGNRVVDIGCGPGTILPYLGDVNYTGFDLNDACIARAQKAYRGRGNFFQGRVEDVADRLESGADIVTAWGILHHLDDQECRVLFQTADRILKPGGRLITVDCVLTSLQNPIARLVMRLDRGKAVRTSDGYLSLAKERFDEVEISSRTDLNRIPYTHCIMICHK
jgi:2-polyprenyl-3-methyl-5-hydroxy-6-metoxy-1,4-benzoquinol methylase